MIALLLPAIALFAADLPAPEPLDGAVSVYRSLPFAAYGEATLLLDLYVPASTPEPVPCIVVIPGGGFRPQVKDRFGDTARRFAEAGFAAASIGYRGWPEHPFPAAVHDTKAAVRFLRAKAGLLSIDPARIGAFGQSAGGHLAAMLAVSDHPDLEGDGGNAGVSSRVQAAVTYAGVFDFIERFRESNENENNPEKRRTNGAWIGEPFSPESAVWRQASPYYHVSTGDAPMLLAHCKDDRTVYWKQSERMYEAMKAVRPESRLLLFEAGGHNLRGSAAVRDEAWSAALAFLRETLLKPQPEAPFVPVVAPTRANVAYGPHGRNVMDVWLAPSDSPTPLLVSIHGGGFRGGNKKVSNRLLAACLESGISVAAITYRLTDEVMAPVPFHDAARAIQYLRHRAAEWNIDPARIAANGDSAGAGLSLWLGFHEDLADPDNTDPVLRESSRLACIAAENGQASYDPRYVRALIPEMATWEHPALGYLFGVKSSEIDNLPEEKYRLFEETAPITHITPDDPPVLMTYNSAADAPVTSLRVGIHHPRFGFALKEKLDAAGVPCVVACGFEGRGEARDALIMDFLREHLLPPAPPPSE
ncbi:MAG: alpha/beta hydrolase [Candidatus Hydrogenedentes bacterium]|nr:alpha/beta hydrolase [Candidatus Hydrogenedentota bacterium]